MTMFNLRFSRVDRSSLFWKILDLLIVILGVTIAFQLSNLKQRSDQHSLERFYVESLITDVESDIASIQYIVGSLRGDSAATASFLAIDKKDTSAERALGNAIINDLSFDTFDQRKESAYQSLSSGSGLSIIQDRNVRHLITEYYLGYKSIDRFEQVYTEFLLNHFHSYFSHYCDYASGRITDKGVLNKVETKDNLLIAEGQLNDGISNYSHELQRANKMHMALVEMLKN